MRAEAELSLDSAPFIAGAQKAARASDDMSRAMSAGAEKAEKSFLGLDQSSLKSSRKVAGNLKAIEAAILSGADASSILQLGLLKVSESFKLGFGGTVATAAVGLAVGKISEAVAESKKLQAALQDALRPDAERGLESIDHIKARIKELDSVIQQAKPKSGFVSKRVQRVFDQVESAVDEANESPGTFFARAAINPVGAVLTAYNTAGPNKEKLGAGAETQRAEQLSNIAKAEARVNDIKEDQFALGQKAVRSRELELEKAHKLAAIEEDLNLPKLRAELARTKPGSGKDQLEKERAAKQKAADEEGVQLDREYNLQKKVAQVELERERMGLAAQRERTFIDRPEMRAESGRTVVTEVGDDLQKVKSVARARLEYLHAQADRDNVDSQGGDTRAADNAVQKADAALRDEVDRVRERNAESRAHVSLLATEMAGQTTLATLARNNLAFEQGIAQARREGNAETETDLRKTRELNTLKARLAATPAERERERRAGLAFSKATEFNGLTSIERDASGKAVRGVDPLTNQYRDITEDDRANAARFHRDPMDGKTKAREASGNRRDFPSRAEENRPSEPPKPPQDNSLVNMAGDLSSIRESMDRLSQNLAVAR